MTADEARQLPQTQSTAAKATSVARALSPIRRIPLSSKSAHVTSLADKPSFRYALTLSPSR